MWSEYLRMIDLSLLVRQELVLAFAQVQRDLGAARGACRRVSSV